MFLLGFFGAEGTQQTHSMFPNIIPSPQVLPVPQLAPLPLSLAAPQSSEVMSALVCDQLGAEWMEHSTLGKIQPQQIQLSAS